MPWRSSAGQPAWARPALLAVAATIIRTLAGQGPGPHAAMPVPHSAATEYSTGGLLSPPTTPGALVGISRNGHTVTTLPVAGLFQPTGLAVGSHGAVYVSNFGSSTAKAAHPGEILKITGLS